MRYLITGGGGMLARELQRRLGSGATCLSRAQLDISDIGKVESAITTEFAAVINCAGMTAVDRCEQEPDRAYLANAVAPGILAMACHRRGLRLVHLSTDYVFAGDSTTPYDEWSVTGPRSVYGSSKLAGEEAVRRHCPDHLILRTSWLYGRGGPSFVHKMLELGRQPGAPFPVVNDQSGNPTSTAVVAAAITAALATRHAGTIHASCEGATTWFGFAEEIIRLAGLPRQPRPCTTSEFPRPAPRPVNSCLDKRTARLIGLPPMPRWQDALADFLRENPHG